jgi:hypothetical protein
MTSTQIAEDILDVIDWQLSEGHVNRVRELIQQYRLALLEEVKFGFDLCSDTSASCLGYKNLVDRIRREKANEPIQTFPEPVAYHPV